jgi:protein disulfide-isomerase A6
MEKAAASLSPLVPAYAVDCDEEKNKRMCAEQGIKGFPTIKVGFCITFDLEEGTNLYL